MKKFMLACLLYPAMVAATTKTMDYPFVAQVLWGSHDRTEFAIFATAFKEDAQIICVSEWLPKESRYDIDQIACHDAVSQPVPKELVK